MTGNDSLVLAAHNNAGHNNRAGTSSPDAPLALIHQGFWGSQWSSFAAGQQAVASSGTPVTPTFTSNANGGNHHTVAAELTVVPEPGSLAVLVLGGLLVARRRRGETVANRQRTNSSVSLIEDQRVA